MTENIPSARYRTIVADPPWHYDRFANNVGTKQSVTLPYPSMTVPEIEALPVGQLADEDCRLFLWTTSRYLPAAFPILDAWGFRYSRVLVWHKPDPPPVTRGHIAWFGVELIVVGHRGSPVPQAIMPSVITHPNQRHSEKPEVFMDWFETVSPGPYLELFARRQRLGWDTWGDQALEHVEVGA